MEFKKAKNFSSFKFWRNGEKKHTYQIIYLYTNIYAINYYF
jgi:hypothetical protein